MLPFKQPPNAANLCKPKIREHFHFEECFFYFTHKIYGILVNIGCASMPDRCRACVAACGGHPDIDLDSMKYKECIPLFLALHIIFSTFRPLAGYGLPPPPQGEFCRPYFS